MVSFDDWTLERLNDLQALSGVGIVAYHISEADIRRTSLFASVRQHNFKRLKIGVNVAEYRNPHRAPKYETERECSLRFCVWTGILPGVLMPENYISVSGPDLKSFKTLLQWSFMDHKAADVAPEMAIENGLQKFVHFILFALNEEFNPA